jgi:hypothetical protein
MVDNNKRHPDQQLPGEYPYVDDYQSRSGHQTRVDDTPGNESLGTFHKKGTYQEINKDGRKVELTVDKAYDYVKGGSTNTVDKNIDSKIGGNNRSSISGDSHEEIAKSNSQVIGKDNLVSAKGTNFSAGSGSGEQVVKGDNILNVKGDRHHSIEGDDVNAVGGNKVETIGGELAINIEGNFDININGNYHIKCKAFTIEAESFTLITSAGPINIKASGSDIILNAGNSLVLKQGE